MTAVMPEQFAIRMTLKQAKKLFLDRPAVISRLDKVARRRLAAFGGYTLRTARNSIKPSRDMRVDELPEDIKELLGELAQPQNVNRDQRGRFVAGARKAQELKARELVAPWPQTTGRPGGAPQYTLDYTYSGKKFSRFKDLIIFIVEANFASVVIGPIIFDASDIPGVLEMGGFSDSYMPRWFKLSDGRIRAEFERKRKRIKAHPYMGPAFDIALKRQIPRIFREIL
jgi:hypothetical protein